MVSSARREAAADVDDGFDIPLDWVVSALAIFLAAGLKLAGLM